MNNNPRLLMLTTALDLLTDKAIGLKAWAQSLSDNTSTEEQPSTDKSIDSLTDKSIDALAQFDIAIEVILEQRNSFSAGAGLKVAPMTVQYAEVDTDL